jgi:regulatory protein
MRLPSSVTTPGMPEREVATVTDIRRSGPAFRRRTIVLDGDGWRDVPASLLAVVGLQVSDEVEVDELAARIEAAEPTLARERAVRLITAKERSHAGLVQRLVDDGFSGSVAEDTVSDMARIGLVDDERFANALARTLARARGAGRARITRELQMAGIDDDLASSALEDALDPDQERVAAARLAASAATRPGATVDRIAARLVRRGYRSAVALSAAREAVEASSGEFGHDPDSAAFDDD